MRPLALLLLAALAAAQEPPPQPPPADPSGAVSGRLTFGDGRPASSALVVLQGNASAANTTIPSRHTRATEGGVFSFKNLEIGRYQIYVEKAGHILEGDKSFYVAQETEPLEDFDLTLRRVPIVTGRVFDADGRPLQSARVAVMREGFAHGLRLLQQANQATTDDRGVYRIRLEDPGVYRIHAYHMEPGVLEDSTLLPTALAFAPGVEDALGAQRLHLAYDQEPVQVDITLPWASDTGIDVEVLSGASGRPCDACQFSLWRQEQGIGYDLHHSGVQQGRVVLHGIPPGQYRFVAWEHSSGEPRYALADFSLAPGRTARGSVVTEPGPTVAGRVTAIDPPDDVAERSVSISFAGGPQTMRFGGRMHVRPTFREATFDMGPQPPQRTTLRIGAPGVGGYLARILRDGRPLESSVVDLADGGSWSNLELEIRFDNAQLSIEPLPGETLPPTDVILLPEGAAAKFQEPLAMSDCSVSCRYWPAPGSYRVLRVPSQLRKLLQIEDPAFPAAISWAERIVLAPGEERTISPSMPTPGQLERLLSAVSGE